MIIAVIYFQSLHPQRGDDFTRSVGLLVCQQDVTNSAAQISTKLRRRTGRGPEYTSVDFGTDQRIFSHFL